MARGRASSYLSLRQLNHDRELAAAIGDMIIAWSHAESACHSALQYILGTDWLNAEIIFTRLPTFDNKVKLLCAALDAWTPPLKMAADIKKSVLKLSALAKTRNDWVHGRWAVGLDDKAQPVETVVFDGRAPIGTPGRKKPVKTADVRHHSETVIQHTNYLLAFVLTAQK